MAFLGPIFSWDNINKELNNLSTPVRIYLQVKIDDFVKSLIPVLRFFRIHSGVLRYASFQEIRDA
jgi:hypothetical protein